MSTHCRHRIIREVILQLVAFSNRPFSHGLKAAVLAAINELTNEIDNTGAVCQRAKDYIHVDECILTFGYSRIVELFLKAAGAKRRFQVRC